MCARMCSRVPACVWVCVCNQGIPGTTPRLLLPPSPCRWRLLPIIRNRVMLPSGLCLHPPQFPPQFVPPWLASGCWTGWREPPCRGSFSPAPLSPSSSAPFCSSQTLLGYEITHKPYPGLVAGKQINTQGGEVCRGESLNVTEQFSVRGGLPSGGQGWLVPLFMG